MRFVDELPSKERIPSMWFTHSPVHCNVLRHKLVMDVRTYGGGGTYPSTRIYRIDSCYEAVENVAFTGTGTHWEMISVMC